MRLRMVIRMTENKEPTVEEVLARIQAYSDEKLKPLCEDIRASPDLRDRLMKVGTVISYTLGNSNIPVELQIAQLDILQHKIIDSLLHMQVGVPGVLPKRDGLSDRIYG